MKKVLVLVGPTAVGKTSLSIELAHRFNGEIISGDSIQVYRGLDIGSGKVTEQEKDGVPHYGIDTLDPKEKYSVADFQQVAREAIEEISSRGKLPMIVGGTGLYVKAALYDYQFQPQDPREMQLAEELEKEDGAVLYERLKEVDPVTAGQIHPNNKRRIVRALVIHACSSQSKSEIESQQQHQMIYDAYICGLTCQRELLLQRIETRVKGMIDQGLQQEIRTLLDQGVTFSDQSMQGIGYKEWKALFEQGASSEEVMQQILKNTRQFSRRQMTWFNHQTPVHWLEIDKEGDRERVIEEISQWLKEEN